MNEKQRVRDLNVRKEVWHATDLLRVILMVGCIVGVLFFELISPGAVFWTVVIVMFLAILFRKPL